MDADALTKFAINHVEKFVLVVVLGAFGFLVYQGLSIEQFDQSKSPENLTQTASQVKSALESDHWGAMKDQPEREFVPEYTEKADEERQALSPDITFDVWNPEKIGPSINKRKDPAIDSPEFAPQEIQVAGVIGAFMMNAPGLTNPHDALEIAPPIEIKTKKKKPTPRRSRRPQMMMEEEGFEQEGPMMNPMASIGPPVRKLDPDFDLGHRAANLMGASSEQTTTIPFTQHFIAGTAVMPNELINDDFQRALAEAKGFDPRRDRPVYVTFQVIRADVTNRDVHDLEEPDDAKIAANKGDWLVATTSRFVDQYLEFWAGSPGEVVSRDYVDDVLTTPLPPLLIKDYLDFAGHPKVPFAGEEEVDEELTEATDDESSPEENPISGPSFGTVLDAEALKKRRAAVNSGMSGMSGMMDENYGSASEDYTEDSDQMGMGMMGMGMMGMSGMSTVVVASEYKLIRFYDFIDSRLPETSPRMGRKYVYRIRVAIQDPNYPIDKRMAPLQKTLDKNALARVQQRQADDVTLAQSLGAGYRTGYRWTAWSQPSSPVGIPSYQSFAVGGATPPVLSKVGDKTLEKEPAKANLVGVNWDRKLATEKTAEFESVSIGAVLNKRSFSDEVVDPLSLEVKKLDNASVVTNGVLLGIQGGDELAISTKEKIYSTPAEFLLVDANGKLHVKKEVSDDFTYRRLTFADEKAALEAAEEAKSQVPSMDDMDSGGMYEESGY